MKISACVICFNEEDKIGRCLESLAVCDELIVVDSGSADRTVEIARQHTEHVFHQDWLGFAGQKEVAWSKASHDWILWMDADEALSPELTEELRELKAAEPEEVAFELPRLTRFLGRWIRHGDWYPDLNIRLFKKSAATMSQSEVHETVRVEGVVGKLEAPILHWPFDSISDLVRKADGYSDLSATSDKKVRVSDLLLRPGFAFFRGYLLRAGFRDGVPGIVVAMMNSASVLFKYAKRYEKRLPPDHQA